MTNPTEDLVIYTTANRPYEPFILPYVASCLEFNPGAYVEVGVEDAERFRGENYQAFELLYVRYGASMDVTNANFSRGAPHSARFLNESVTQRKFTYIGDIDILILEEIAPKHIENMQALNLPYSNILRRNRKALSGLHFTKTDAFYPIQLSDHGLINLDEQMLYQMVKDKGLGLPDETSSFRPLHGFHMSLNRRPYCSQGLFWGLDGNAVKPYLKFTQSDFWKEIFNYFDPSYKALFIALDFVLELRYVELYKQIDRRWLLADRLFK